MVSIFLPFLLAQVASCMTSTEIKAQLLAGYDKNKWPGWNPTLPTPTVVSTQYYVNSLWGVDQKMQQFTAEVYFRAYWTDPRLAYNRSLMSEVQFGEDAHQLWLPDFYWPNSRGMQNDESLLEVYPDGSIWWSQRKRITFTCLMYFHRLPFDTQDCSMVVSTYSDKASQAQLQWKDAGKVADGLDLVNNNEWDIGKSATGIKETVVYAGGSKYDELTARLSFKRRPVLAPIFITSLFVVISYCGFWINPAAAPGRITLSVICVLLVLSYLSSEMRSYPTVSYRVWLQVYMMGCLVFTLVAVFEYPIVNFGMTMRAKLAEKRKEEHQKAMEGVDLDDIRVSQCSSGATFTPPEQIPRWKLRLEAFFTFCNHLDFYFRAMYPLAFIIFVLVCVSWEPPHPNQPTE